MREILVYCLVIKYLNIILFYFDKVVFLGYFKGGNLVLYVVMFIKLDLKVKIDLIWFIDFLGL